MRSAVRTLARSRPQNYTGLNSARDMQLRIIARSTYSAICGAPHIAQFERDLIQERTRAGLAAAAARGRTGGRKPVITADKLDRARAIISKGLTVREAAIRLKVGKTALYAALRP